MAKTNAQRQKEYRERIKKMAAPEVVKATILDAYMRGFSDAHQGLEPAPPKNVNLALAYVCGGMDAV